MHTEVTAAGSTRLPQRPTAAAAAAGRRRVPRVLVVAGLASLGLLGMAAAGCSPKKQATMEQPATQPASPQVDDVDARVAGLNAAAAALASHAGGLPGRSAEEHVSLMRQVFGDLAQALPLLEGPNPGGVFRQQLRTVQSSATQLAGQPTGMSPEPMIDEGLRAATDAIAAISTRNLFEAANQSAPVEQLRAGLSELDRTRGPIHQLAVADVVGQMSEIVGALAKHLESEAASGEVTDSNSTTAPADGTPAAPADGAPTEPAAPAEPTPSEPDAPTSPAPTDPAPAEPAPADPASADPAPADAAPADAAPADPASPADPAPVEPPAPDAAPSDPAPAEAAPGAGE